MSSLPLRNGIPWIGKENLQGEALEEHVLRRLEEFFRLTLGITSGTIKIFKEHSLSFKDKVLLDQGKWVKLFFELFEETDGFLFVALPAIPG